MIKGPLEHIAQHINARFRLFFPSHRMSLLRNRLEERLVALNIPDLTSYQVYLQNSPEEEAVLADLLTTNETFFFRNPKQFRYLSDKIVPELELQKGQEMVRLWGRNVKPPAASLLKLRIFCAGCSTGEEPYSVAMTLLESLRYPRAWDIEIIAGDISPSCIQTATDGFYEKERLKDIPRADFEKYMDKTPDGAFIKSDVRKLVKFVRMNLNDFINGNGIQSMTTDDRGFDIIFCRNVMIYFSLESQQQLVDTLFKHVVPGGYLFTGDAEPLHLYEHDFAMVHEAGCLIYKKTGNENVI